MATNASPLTVTWCGHATVLLELDGVRVLTDPVLRDRIGPLMRIAEPFPINRLARVDCVLLSHLHGDHADVPTLRRIASSVPLLAPRGAGDWLRAKGLADVTELAAGDSVEIGAVRLTATPARHEGRRVPFGPIADAIGCVLRGSRSAYFAGDTDLFDDMSALRRSVDLALLPVSGWGPTLGPGHLDPRRAARAAELIAPAVAVPIHWGTFTVGGLARASHDPVRPAREFRELCRQFAPGVETRILTPGETTSL